MKNRLFGVLALSTLTACGGGGSSGGGTDPSAYSPTTTGSGSTTTTAQTSGTIKYAQYQQTTTGMMTDKAFSPAPVSATVTYDATSKQGSIHFPVLGASETITTTDGYATTRWAGPFMSGSYIFNGNILVGCNSTATDVNAQTQIFVSSNLTRVQNGSIDDMNGQSFVLYDCSMLQNNQVGSLKINTDGSLFLSTANATVPKNQVFDMLNPELGYGGAFFGSGPYSTKGGYNGHAFKYGVNGVTKYAIVIETNANNNTNGSSFHYLLAVQQ